MFEDLKKRIALILTILVFVFTVGTLGYIVIEGWEIPDAVFMTVITLATVGYGETHPLSTAGRLFTILLIIIGIGFYSYGFLTIVTIVTEGKIQKFIRRNKMDKKIKKLHGHYIICGLGETGKHVVNELNDLKKNYVIIDSNPECIEKLESEDILHVQGDASVEESLSNAGIDNAKGIFCTLPEDKDNLFVVLTARGLNQSIRIISKCIDEESYQKFIRAGADKVISPNHIGGLRMASEMLRPNVVSFLDLMLRDKRGIRFDEIEIDEHSKFLGKTLAEINLRNRLGVSVIAIRNNLGEYIYNPDSSLQMQKDDILIILGSAENVDNLRNFK